MEDRAYRHIYGRPVFHTIRVALVTMLRELTIGENYAHPETRAPLIDQSIMINEVADSKQFNSGRSSRQAALKDLEQGRKLGIYSQLTREEIKASWPKEDPKFESLDINRAKTYLYFTPAQWDKLRNLTGLFEEIERVIDEQKRNPHGGGLRAETLPPGVFYDIEQG